VIQLNIFFFLRSTDLQDDQDAHIADLSICPSPIFLLYSIPDFDLLVIAWDGGRCGYLQLPYIYSRLGHDPAIRDSGEHAG
jgi:hypothetical protein